MKKELTALRTAMERCGIDWYIVPTEDFHGSEYVAPYFKARAYLSGFTGSAGTLLVGRDMAGLWTDGRYFLQAAKELEDSGIELMKSGEEGVPTIEDFLKGILREDECLGFDGRVVSGRLGKTYEDLVVGANGSLKTDVDLAGEVWPERPALIGNRVVNYPVSYAGLEYEEKLRQVREALAEGGYTHTLVPGLEENAWLFNLRGSDVGETPVFFAFSLIGPTEVTLYCFQDALRETHVPDGVKLKDYFAIFEDMKTLPDGTAILVPSDQASYTLVTAPGDGVKIFFGPSPITSLKAVKNSVELASTRHAHLDDAVAMVSFMAWFDKAAGKEHVTELSLAKRLEEYRAVMPTFRGLSFTTIAGYGPHGAIIHYSATPETDAAIQGEGFLLLDSGGQYLNGTTDITRTIACGPLTDKMKQVYTAVLKGHLQLSMANFEPGTVGTELDALARKPIQDLGYDYNHGTGHGVGHYLSVHEGPNNFSPKRGTATIVPGMITTDEPGVYLEGEFGVRLENELLCVSNNRGGLCFQPLTLVPFDRRAILVSELTSEERDYLNTYHNKVYRTLKPRLEPAVAKWLEAMTAKL